MVCLRETFWAHLSLVYLQKRTQTQLGCFTLHNIRVCGIPVCAEDMFILLGSIMNLFNIL